LAKKKRVKNRAKAIINRRCQGNRKANERGRKEIETQNVKRGGGGPREGDLPMRRERRDTTEPALSLSRARRHALQST